jgi:hypothetical protein
MATAPQAMPYGLGEQRLKLYNQWQQFGRQYQQLKTSRGKSGLQLTWPGVTFSKIKNGQSRADISLEPEKNAPQVISPPIQQFFIPKAKLNPSPRLAAKNSYQLHHQMKGDL